MWWNTFAHLSIWFPSCRFLVKQSNFCWHKRRPSISDNIQKWTVGLGRSYSLILLVGLLSARQVLFHIQHSFTPHHLSETSASTVWRERAPQDTDQCGEQPEPRSCRLHAQAGTIMPGSGPLQLLSASCLFREGWRHLLDRLRSVSGDRILEKSQV